MSQAELDQRRRIDALWKAVCRRYTGKKNASGFGRHVGLLGMIEVVDDCRSEGPADDANVGRWEVWILGQSMEVASAI
jgi:hypothetical protein